MANAPGVPSVIWQDVQDTTIELSVGCGSCAFEGVDAPLTRVYLWGGTSLCVKHLLALRNNG
jgi:hypothetical protein